MFNNVTTGFEHLDAWHEHESHTDNLNVVDMVENEGRRHMLGTEFKAPDCHVGIIIWL